VKKRRWGGKRKEGEGARSRFATTPQTPILLQMASKRGGEADVNLILYSPQSPNPRKVFQFSDNATKCNNTKRKLSGTYKARNQHVPSATNRVPKTESSRRSEGGDGVEEVDVRGEGDNEKRISGGYKGGKKI